MKNLKYLFGEPPESGKIKEIWPGIYWLRMPLPMALNHINLWLLHDYSGWTLVDTGLSSKLSVSLWQKLIDEYIGDRKLKRIIVTHFHPDHVGMAGWLVKNTGADLWMPRTEWLYARLLTLDTTKESASSIVEYYRRAGGSLEYLSKLKERGPLFPGIVSDVPRQMRRIIDGQLIDIDGKTWKVVMGNGHSPEHACLLCESLGCFIAGDLILPRISPHIGVYADEPNGNPLCDYLETLDRFSNLPGSVTVLASHNEPFIGLHERRVSLIQHHLDRLEEFVSACAVPVTAIELASNVFKRSLDSSQLGFAAAETIAHLNYLMAQNKIERSITNDGVYLYSQSN